MGALILLAPGLLVVRGRVLPRPLLVGQLQTAGAILIEEVGFRRYRNRDLMLLGAWSLLELFWYRPLTALWRIWATVLVLRAGVPGGDRSRAARPSATSRSRTASRRRFRASASRAPITAQ